MARCVMDYSDIETGGDIFGFWTHSGYPSIQYIIGPGPNSNRSSVSFYQDRQYLIEMGKLLREKYGLQHIGEWHSHHKLSLAEPSGGDIRTIRNAIDRYQINYFFLTICNIGQKEVTINGFHFFAGKNDFDRAEWVTLEGTSPIRREFDRDYKDLIYRPKQENVDYIARPITTLDSVTFEKEETAQFPENSWMNTNEWKEMLKTLIETLKRRFNDVKIFQGDDKRIKLQVYADKPFIITFPHDFPKNKPEINYSQEKDNGFFNNLNSRLTRKGRQTENIYNKLYYWII